MIRTMIEWGALAAALVYCLWLFYVAVMNLKRVRDAGKLTGVNHALGVVTLVIGFALDLVVHLVIGSLLFLELPRRGELTLSRRITRLVATGQGWRSKVALWIRTQMLDDVDPEGVHRG